MATIYDAADIAVARPQAVQRVCFFFNAQLHQLLHGVTVAVSLSRLPGFDVHILSPSEKIIDYARALIDRLGGAPVTLRTLAMPGLSRVNRAIGRSTPPKVVTLALAARRLAGFDAIAVPERTSILLKRLGLKGPRFIHLDHGAGDRAVGFDPRIRLFDFVLMAGEKHRGRMLREGLVRPGAHAVVGYPKFDAADAVRDPHWSPFDNGRPIVLYNPHFADLGSWRSLGLDIVRQFAEQDRYNLILAPHIRLFAQRNSHSAARELLETFASVPHIHIDLGSERSVDMSYTMLADIYLGDVSSQIYEFLRTQRPCLFLNPHGVEWEDDENYAHWRFGPVISGDGDIVKEVNAAVASHAHFRSAQKSGWQATFCGAAPAASERAADAIATYLTGEAGLQGPLISAA
jgi:hypothetical protein